MQVNLVKNSLLSAIAPKGRTLIPRRYFNNEQASYEYQYGAQTEKNIFEEAKIIETTCKCI